MLSQLLAAFVLLICIALAVHMAVRPALQRRVDAGLQRMLWQLRQRWQGRSDTKQAEEIAAATAKAAIERARARPEGQWEGNVYRPRRFGKTRDKDKLH
jgi:hypothetical protein